MPDNFDFREHHAVFFVLGTWNAMVFERSDMKKLEKLGKYEIRGELGRGAMGVVYEAFDPLIERAVAIKTILKSAIDKHEAKEVFNRFRREARAVGRLAHPKIVSIYEYGEDNDVAFIVMELIHGKELKEYFECEQRFTIGEGIRIVIELLDALVYSHARGVVHRDIKPANIMITDDGQIKVTDFGIAKIDSSNLTVAGEVLGTPTYMSPEQIMGDEVDHRTDIYAAGVVLFQFLTGERPFSGGLISMMRKIVHENIVAPSKLNHDVPKQLDEVVIKAMAKRPEDRFQSATGFINALKTVEQMLHVSEPPAVDVDATMIVRSPPLRDEALAPSSGVNLAAPSREADADSLKEYPAQKRGDQANPKQKAHAAPEEKRNKEVAKQESLNAAKAKEKAEAEAKSQTDAVKNALMAHRLAKVKSEAANNKVAEDAKRKKEALEEMQRARELAAFMSEHAKKLAEFVAAKGTATPVAPKNELTEAAAPLVKTQGKPLK